MSVRKELCAALLTGAVCACTVSVDNSSGSSGAAVTGTYVTRGSGTTFGKPWSYSGALVLDSTKHFGAVFTGGGALNIESDSPDKVNGVRGSYRVLVTRRRRHGQVTRTTRVELRPDQGDRDRHTLTMRGDSLSFAGPWWFSVGLSALGIPEPVFVRLPDSTAAKLSAPADSAAKTSASSTPRLSRKDALKTPR